MRKALTPPALGEVHLWRIALPGEGGRDAARGAAAAILADYLGGAAAAKTSAAADGKPRLAEEPGRLSFNLSHSGGLALMAIAPGEVEVGVDLERLKPRRDLARLAERWLPADDAAAVASAEASAREALFYAAWTRHEARVKCAGTGLSGPPPPPRIAARQLEIAPGYAAALALNNGPAAVADTRLTVRDRIGGRG